MAVLSTFVEGSPRFLHAMVCEKDSRGSVAGENTGCRAGSTVVSI